MISVIIPTYQHAGTIADCLDSIFGQTLKPDEMIVVNDGSTDGTSEVLRQFEMKNWRQAPRYCFSFGSDLSPISFGKATPPVLSPDCPELTVIDQENRGAQAARNRGWKASRGDLLLFCDADVRMHPDMLEKMSAALAAHPEASYAYGAFRFGWKTFGGIPFSADRLREYNFIHTSSLVRAKDFPGFDESIKRLQDWDVWLTMLEAGKTGILVPEILCDVAVDGTSRIGSSWLPRFLYRIPWNRIGWMPRVMRRYHEARAVLAKKHHLL